jgi:hypothetical protein
MQRGGLIVPPRTWTIRDLDGSNPRTVTLAQFLADNRAKADAAKAIHAANVRQMQRGD